MKKLLAIVLSIAVLACCVVVGVSADGENTTGAIGSATIGEDGTAIVSVVIDVPEGIAFGAVEITLCYDNTKFAPLSQNAKKPDDLDKSVATGEVVEGGMMEVNAAGEPYFTNGQIKIAYINSDGISDSGEWFTAQFKALEGAAEGEYPITAIDATGTDAEDTSKVFAINFTGGKLIIGGEPSSEPESSEEPSSEPTSSEEPAPSSSTPAPTSSTPATSDTSKTPASSGSVPKTADSSVVVIAGIVALAAAAAFVITKKVND